MQTAVPHGFDPTTEAPWDSYAGLAFFLASLCLYDLLTIGRVHRATLLGSTLRMLLVIGVGGHFGVRIWAARADLDP